jgi:hypothetical protein
MFAMSFFFYFFFLFFFFFLFLSLYTVPPGRCGVELALLDDRKLHEGVSVLNNAVLVFLWAHVECFGFGKAAVDL